MIKMNDLLEVVMSAAVDYNDNNADHLGVAFVKEHSGIWDAVIGSNAHAIKITNVEAPETDFFSYADGKFTIYKYPVPVDRILDVVDMRSEESATLATPMSNFINHIERIIKLEQSGLIVNAVAVPGDKSRFVFKQTHQTLDPGEVCVVFKNVEGRRVFNFKDKTLYVSPYSSIPENEIVPGVYYKAIPSEKDGQLILDVLAKYGSVMMGYIYSKGLYTKAQAPEISASDPTTYMFNAVRSNDLSVFPEMHFRVKLMRIVSRCFRLFPEDTIIEMHFPMSSHEPMTMYAEFNESSIVAKISPLNLDMDKQWG